MTELVDFITDLLTGAQVVALSLAVGGIVWGLLVLRPWRCRSDASAGVRPCLGLVLAGAFALALAQTVELALRAWILAEALGRSPFPSLLHTPLFQAGLARAFGAGALGAAAAWLRRRPVSRRRWAAAACLATVVLANGAWLVHAVGRLDGRGQLMAMTALHELGAVAWAGGIAQLVALWRYKRRRPELEVLWSVALRRFSSVAVAAVALIIASGGGLVWSYVGTWRALVGTGYGALVVTKVVLLAAALGMAATNFRAARREACAELQARVPPLVEAEAALLLVLLFAAAALASQPPAVDTVTEAATWSEVVEVFTPKPPRMTSPTHDSVVETRPDPLAPPSQEPTLGDAWSEFNHNVAGLFVIGMAVIALADWTHPNRWTRHWPLGLVVLAAFLLFRNDPESWPLGPVPLRESLVDADVLQHRLGALLAGTIGLVEWRARAPRSEGSRLPYLFPILALGGGILLLMHSHSAFQVKSEFLIQISHTAMGVLAVFVGCARWLELRLGPPAGRLAGLGGATAMLLIGAILTSYRETQPSTAPPSVHQRPVRAPARSERYSPVERSRSATRTSHQHGFATYPDVRDAEHGLARAQTLDVDARSQVFTSAAALALSTGDLARPSP